MAQANLLLYLKDDTSSSLIYDDLLAPFTLTIDPRYVGLPKKIRMVEYIWGDGTTDIVKYVPNPDHGLISSLPYSYDVGNPLNYPKTKTFYSKDLSLSVYNITINFYCFTEPDIVKSFNLTLNIKNPDINSYFYEFHLIKTKMYGLDDKILYTFQSQHDDYILMSNVNWKLKPISISPKIQSTNFPYRLLKPFETNYKSNTNITEI